jgi:Tfp pilus assembly protein PilN
MIQFNLLPDIKVQYIKARKAKRMIIVISILSVIVSVGLLIIMVSATAYQKHRISDYNKQIASAESTLQGTTDLAKILTIQNQLHSLPALYAQRPVTSRLFDYVQQTTPSKVSITHLVVDFDANTINVEGTADSLASINTYVDTVKFTTYSVKDVTGSKNAFTSVVLSTFSRDSKTAAFKVTYSYDVAIFDASKDVTLNVPKTTTTRSETELPGAGVFDAKGTN